MKKKLIFWMLDYGFLEVKMNLEKKFMVDLNDKKDFISWDGFFSHVFKIYDDNGEVYCGKFPKVGNFGYFLREDVGKFRNILKAFDLDNFSKSSFYEFGIAKDIWSKFNLAMKPEGVYEVKIKGTENLFLPAFVNELAINMNPNDLNEKEYQNYLVEKEKAFMKVIGEGYYMHLDSDNDNNCFYSKKRGFKFNDFGLWGKNGKFNFHVSGGKTFFNAAKDFVQGKKMEWDLF